MQQSSTCAASGKTDTACGAVSLLSAKAAEEEDCCPAGVWASTAASDNDSRLKLSAETAGTEGEDDPAAALEEEEGWGDAA